MSFAIIETGGKQYKVAEGDVLSVEKIKEKEVKDSVVFDKVLLFDDGKDTKIGSPYLKDVTVEAEITEEGKGKKLNIMKFKSKSRYKRRIGHRQHYSKILIKKIK
jgi:large subunit ribosomal protein L21